MFDFSSVSLRRGLGLLSLGIALQLSGCAAFSSKPVKTPDFPLPAAWQADTAQANDTPAITRAEDLIQYLDSAELESLLQQAILGNFDLQVAAARLNEAAANAGVDSSALWPRLEASLSGSRTETDSGLVFSPETYQLRATLSWEIDLWGRLRNQRNASRYSLDAAVANYQAARLSLAGNLAIAWYDYLAAQQQVRLSQRNQKATELILSSVDKRFRKGLVSSLDLSLARTGLATGNADLLQAHTNLANTRRVLLSLLGPGGELPGDDTSIPLPNSLPDIPPSVPVQVVRYRPDIIAAERNYRSLVALWKATGKQALPSLSLNANTGRQSREFSGLSDSINNSTTISAQLAASIFDFGRIRSLTEGAGARAEQQFQNYSKLVFDAVLESQQWFYNDQQLQQQMLAQDKLTLEATRSSRIALRDYNDGLAAINSVITAEQDAINAERSQVNIHNQWLANRVRLLLSIGGYIPELENTLLPPVTPDANDSPEAGLDTPK